MENANNNNILIAMIESEEGINNIDSILSISGIDMVWLGHFDLTDSLGSVGDFEDKYFLKCITTFIDHCKKHQKPAGFLDVNKKMLSHFKKLGFKVLGYGHDVVVFQNSLKRGIDMINTF